ncbi:MAG: cytochrome c oxidase subunit 3 [Acidothermaceae bacterium]
MTAVTAGHPVPHHEDRETIGRRWRTGVILLLVADAAFVGSLIFSYFYLRGLNTEGGWFPKGSSITPIWIGWAIAAGLVVSAAVYRWGERGLAAGVNARLVTASAIGTVIVAADAVGQVAQLVTLPFGLADGSYASSVYVLASANLFHLLLTLFLGIGMWNRSRLGRYAADNNWQVRLVSIWWTWIAIAAILSAFTTSFIASPNHIVSTVVGG